MRVWLMGMNIPAGYGGAEVGVVATALRSRKLQRVCASHAVNASVTPNDGGRGDL